jgi:hypothetical protein
MVAAAGILPKKIDLLFLAMAIKALTHTIFLLTLPY